ncbi:MAG: elongation factor P--(R)-beta-lysine ligase [Spirochaetales bacterium]|nr:elongation factor P--(R)-beta-lysine ligase [Spirochaetales bacterium]
MNQSRRNLDILKRRNAVLSAIRSFFSGRGYIEAETPLLAGAVIPEASIELFSTSYRSPYAEGSDMYLLPSPEYYLKQLIAAGSGDIFCLSKCFRNSEQTGRWHNPEFTMLEWYQMNANYLDSIATAEDLTGSLIENTEIRNFKGTDLKALTPPFRRMSMTEVFDEFVSFDLSRHCTGEISDEEQRAQLRAKAAELGLGTSSHDSWEELFNLIFVHEVEPNLPADSPLVIYNYPAGIPALARPAEENGRLERWELYAGSIELANCYTEETDGSRIEEFFRSETRGKAEALVPVKADLTWCGMYDGSFPDCSGTAMGIDRLIMLLTGIETIEGVILFPFSDIIRR